MAWAIAALFAVIAGSPARAQGDNGIAGDGSLPLPPPLAGSSITPRLRGRQPSMPVNGALAIESPDPVELPEVYVLDPSGATVQGALRQVGELEQGLLFAWVPSMLPTPGMYKVGLNPAHDPWSRVFLDFEVVAAFPDELPPVNTAPSTSVLVVPVGHDCCSTPIGDELTASCFVVEQEVSLRVDAGLSSSSTSAQLDQYVFRLSALGTSVGGGPEPFRPFELVHDAVFYENTDEHCLQLQAMNIATEAVKSYAEPICAESVERDVGIHRVELDARYLAMNVCYVPPSAQKERWCTINAGACATRVSTECELYEHVCSDGPVPAIWQQLLATRAVPHDAIEPKRPSPKCSVSPGASQSLPLSVLLMLLGVMATFLRRWLARGSLRS